MLFRSRVLSEGIFERLAAKKAGLYTEDGTKKKTDKQAKKPGPEFGQPILPDYKEIKKWYEIKDKFETTLEDKVTRQIMGILPLGSYKVAINADIGPLKNGKIVEIKRMSTSIVVDNNNDDVFLDTLTKKQLFNTVSSVVGYVKGRDSIQLSKADFLLLSDAEKKRLEELREGEKSMWLPFLMFGLPLTLLVSGFLGWRRYKRKQAEANRFSQEDERETDFDGLKDEMAGTKNLEALKAVAASEPHIIAQIMEDWLKDELGDEPAAQETSPDDTVDATDELDDDDEFEDDELDEEELEEFEEMEESEEVPA